MNTIKRDQLHPFLTKLEVRLNELKEEATQGRREFGRYSQQLISPFNPIGSNEELEELEESVHYDFQMMRYSRSNVNLLKRLPWKVAMEARLCNHYSKIPGQIDVALKWLIDAHKDLALIDHARSRTEAEAIYRDPQQRQSSIKLEKAKALFLEIIQPHQPQSTECTIDSLVGEISEAFITRMKLIDPETHLTGDGLYESVISWRGRDEDFKKAMDRVINRLRADAKGKNA